MPKLQDKFQVEMKDDAQVLACRFPLPNWKPTEVIEEGIDTVWLYQKPKSWIETFLILGQMVFLPVLPNCATKFHSSFQLIPPQTLL